MIVTGHIRRIDDLGRVQIPKEIRQKLKIKEGQQLEIQAVNGIIIISKGDDENEGF